MANFKVSMFFKHSTQEYGWTENYYCSAADIATANTQAVALADVRKDILSTLCVIQGIRVSDMAVLRDSVYIPNYPQAGTGGGGVGTTTEPTTCMVTRLEAGALHRGRVYLHGLNTALFSADGTYDPGNPDILEVAAYEDLLKGGLWKVRSNFGPTYTTITAVYFLRMGSHRVGRPFGLLRGRRKRRP